MQHDDPPENTASTALLDMEQERAAFELWVISLQHWPKSRSSGQFERSPAVPDMYYNSNLDNMWRGWMASAAGGAAERARWRIELFNAQTLTEQRVRELVLECLVRYGILAQRDPMD